MPRQPRLDIPGALHHIMIRGINRAPLFYDDRDRTRFLEKLDEYINAGACAVYAFALMDNHVHILFRSGERGISSVMRKLLTWYAQYFNRRHGRTGHLFENRYKSILCEEESYFLELIRYIHLNPVRADIVKSMKSLAQYPWTGHGAIMGSVRRDWMDINYVLRQFGRARKPARAAYQRFVSQGFAMGQRPDLVGGGLIRSLGGWSQVISMQRKDGKVQSDERILGGSSFVQSILKEAEDRQKRQLKIRLSGRTITHIIHEECTKRGVNRTELEHGGRRHKVSQARTAIAYRSATELGLSAADIARHLGVNTSCISRAIERAEKEGIN